ncbi:MAG: NAD(P)/FAD-dependent oxidoreductase, partial [Burkholderiaceae bacterium]
AERFDLRRDIVFERNVTTAHWHEASRTWQLTLDTGERLSARFLITAIGALSVSTLPRIEGVDSFRGQSCHTAQWPHEPVRFEGKRVAVIGTGATGVQTIQEVAKTAAHLTVFQRTPNWCAPLHNRPISAEEQQKIKASYPEIFQRCRESVSGFIHTPDPRSTKDVSPEEREAFWEKRYAEPGFGIWVGNFRDVLVDREANALMSDFVARKIRQRVKDPAVAEKLIPKNHGFGTRRLPLETRYYEVYNQSNVELVDLTETPIERITPTGIRTTARDFEFDMIIYATGFDALRGAYDRIDIRGTDGRSLKDAWNGGAQTFFGIQNAGFPNLLMVMGPMCALGNIPRSIEYNVEWVTGLLRHMQAHGKTRVDAPPASVQMWMDVCRKASEGLLSNEVNSWMTGVNLNVDGKTTRVLARYSGTGPEFRARADAVAAGGYRELELA